MDTLLTFLIIFIPAGLCFWQLMRFTRDTVGTRSPLKISRVYKTTALSFFFRLDSTIPLYCFFVSGLLFKVCFLKPAPVSVFLENAALKSLTLTVMIALFLLIGILSLAIDLNHWQYAKNVVITTMPEQHTIELKMGDTELILNEGDIQAIHHYHNDAKLRKAYGEYQLTNGDFFFLPDTVEGVWVIKEYFKNIPEDSTVKTLPFIKQHSGTESAGG
jgi:hypothetical protein